VHVQYAWPIVGQIFVYGLVLGVARWRSGSLWPPLVMHVLINLYAVIAAYYTYGAPA
jgi:membrane protease YdiL (CAAX protease family)